MGLYENPPYYISAYGLAVKRGFAGTLDEWLASLVGPTGPQGAGLVFDGTYPTLEALQQAHPTGQPGDCYKVGTDEEYVAYFWDPENQTWDPPAPRARSAPPDRQAPQDPREPPAPPDHRDQPEPRDRPAPPAPPAQPDPRDRQALEENRVRPAQPAHRDPGEPRDQRDPQDPL